jgi:hypothetical protein
MPDHLRPITGTPARLLRAGGGIVLGQLLGDVLMGGIELVQAVAQRPPRRHCCRSCGGFFDIDSDAPRDCHGGSSCPFDEPDNWETYEPDYRETDE